MDGVIQKKVSAFRFKKGIFIDILFLQTWQRITHIERSHWKLVGCRRPISKTPRKKDHNNAELHAAEVKGQCCDSLQGLDSIEGMIVLQGPTSVRHLWGGVILLDVIRGQRVNRSHGNCDAVAKLRMAISIRLRGNFRSGKNRASEALSQRTTPKPLEYLCINSTCSLRHDVKEKERKLRSECNESSVIGPLCKVWPL